MSKKPLHGELMSAAHVEQAAGIARWFTQREARGPGDMENAWRRLEARYGLPWRLFWSLRYRPPSSIASDLYAQLCAAYDAERERQMKLLRHDIDITEEISGPDSNSVRAAKTLLGEDDG